MFKSGRQYEDMVSATCTLSGGLMSNHLVNWLSPTKERLTVVTGERGMFVADTLTDFRGVSEGDMTRFAIPKPEPLRTEHENFRDAVLGKEGATIVTLDEGARVVEVCEAMIESSRTNQFVAIS
ncbi:Uncharacterised protein [Mycobacteroides abscessus subsp. abscessus]|nr:Uncharacterised protein [Mycobacteroides abscessus subsp. abscessus]